jgi:hydrogenase expression/formation protein HypC
MCLGVPGKLVAWIRQDPIFGLALIEFAGVRQECHMACVPDAAIGDFVIVHAGIAISRIHHDEAARTLREFAAIGESLDAGSAEESGR